jgi:hypothetical protein
VVNDELIVTDDDGELFEYNPSGRESQRVQEALFHEKHNIIENCLFGVDINPNSVKICRLRLWIELLKHAYYKWPNDSSPFGGGREGAGAPFADGTAAALETLPNIDINIKCGNSLISRFDLDADLSKALKDSKWSIDSYRVAVDTYRNAHNKEQKREMEKIIHDIKSDFRSEISTNDPKVKRLEKVKGEIFLMANQTQLFEMSKREKTAWNKKLAKLTKDSKKWETEIQEIKDNKIYENAFEWRFEFPEVLDDNGNYVGFDVVIGNPPYVFSRENLDTQSKNYFNDNYEGIDYQVNLYVLFAELALKVLAARGNYGLIVPNSLLMVSSTEKIRRLLFKNASIMEVVNFLGESFEGVNVETISYFGVKGKFSPVIKVSIGENGIIQHLHDKRTETILKSEDLILNVFSSDATDEFLLKIKKESVLLNDIVDIKAGLKAYEVGKGTPKQIREDVTNRIYDYDYKFDETTFPYLEGKDVDRYVCHENSSFLKYGENLAAPRTIEIFSQPKIILREITGQHPHSLLACYTEETVLFNMSNIAINSKEGSNIELKFILGLINSKLISYYFQLNTAKAVRRLFPKIILKDLRKFPIRIPSTAQQSAVIEKVDKVLDLKRQNPSADTSSLEAEIDRLVYELYGLTEEEIQIIENSIK